MDKYDENVNYKRNAYKINFFVVKHDEPHLINKLLMRHSFSTKIKTFHTVFVYQNIFYHIALSWLVAKMHE